jgi:hypothetical protein
VPILYEKNLSAINNYYYRERRELTTLREVALGVSASMKGQRC